MLVHRGLTSEFIAQGNAMVRVCLKVIVIYAKFAVGNILAHHRKKSGGARVAGVQRNAREYPWDCLKWGKIIHRGREALVAPTTG